MKLANGFQSSVRFISLMNETWEHRSFKELGIDALPTIHLGSEANALENKGIHTERGDYNRKVMELRGLAKFIDYTSVMIENYKKVAAMATRSKACWLRLKPMTVSSRSSMLLERARA